MKILIFVITVLISQNTLASQLSCAASEKNAETNNLFTTFEYQETLKYWESEEPAAPGLLRLFRAYNLYQNEKSKVAKIRGDKKKHCYLGCRMAEDIDLKTSVYVAWYKEQKDLTDCNSRTLFEVADFDATVEGAEKALRSNSSQSCFDICAQ